VVRNVAGAAIAAVALAACAGHVRGPSSAPLTVKEIVDRSKPAIVRIVSTFTLVGPGGKPVEVKGVGTGFVVGADGRIVTNLHVIFDVEHNAGPAVNVTVELLDGTKLVVERVVDIDPKQDLAVLAVKAGHALPVLALGDSDRVATGERVVAIGNPLGYLDYTVSDGLISGVRVFSPEVTRIQFSAPISQGSSGGPLFNNHGEVIGVAQGIAFDGQNVSQNLNFGVPANYIKPLLSQHGGKTLAEMRAAMAAAQPPPEARPIQRDVPTHPLTILDECKPEAVARVFHAIGVAIHKGAPLYNQGDHEACYYLYEGTALRVDREGWCKPLGDALLAGVTRAHSLTTFTEKAWAMRDAFDGILGVVARKIQSGDWPPETRQLFETPP
jgi:serine protease Do